MGLLTLLGFVFGLLAVTACSPSHGNSSTPVKPVITKENENNVREFGDVLRVNNPDVAKALSDPQFTAVTREFGYTIIQTSKLPIRSRLATSKVKPWSSWWFPKVDSLLFEESDSPLSKYDLFRANRYRTQGKSTPKSAASYANENQDYNPAIWEGLCDAWTLAAIANAEPKRSVTLMIEKKPLTFTVADLKALLLLTYEAVDDSSLKYYGQKFTGEYNGWIYPDIFPEQLHRFVEVQLFEKEEPFMMDHDPGPQVWTNPVYKANYTIEKVDGEANAVFVRMWVFTAEFSPEIDKNFVGLIDAVREYDYILQGERNSAGDLVIKSGYWVKREGIDSRLDHPDYVYRRLGDKPLVRKSWNPEIEVDLVDEILAQSY